MRTLKELTEEQRGRLTEYVRYHSEVPTSELAKDICLRPGTIAAIKAHLTRQGYRYSSNQS